MFLAAGEVLAEGEHRHAHAGRAWARMTCLVNFVCGPTTSGAPFLMMPAFLAAMPARSSPRNSDDPAHRLDHRHGGIGHHIGGVIGAAQPTSSTTASAG
jgi:hypothetical protein